MRVHATRSFTLAVLLAAAVATVAGAAQAATTSSYWTMLTGAAESPPNASLGFGSAQVEIDPFTQTMRVRASFMDLTGTVTACHIHGPTATPGTGTAGVMTPTPTFPGFPSGVTAGIYDMTFDMTLATSYNPNFISNNGGTTATAETALFQAIMNGEAYFNVHTTAFPGGEIRGFFQLLDPTPTTQTTWGAIKQLYR